MKVGFLDESEGVRSSGRLIFVSGSYFVMAVTVFLLINMVQLKLSLMEIGLFAGGLEGLFGGTKLARDFLSKADAGTESKEEAAK